MLTKSRHVNIEFVGLCVLVCVCVCVCVCCAVLCCVVLCCVLDNIQHKNNYLETCCNYINNCPTRCNTKQSIYYSASSLYMFRLSTTPIIRSTQNSNCSFQYCSYLSPTWPTWPRWRELPAQINMTCTGGCSYIFVYSWWWVWLTAETCNIWGNNRGRKIKIFNSR